MHYTVVEVVHLMMMQWDYIISSSGNFLYFSYSVPVDLLHNFFLIECNVVYTNLMVSRSQGSLRSTRIYSRIRHRFLLPVHAHISSGYIHLVLDLYQDSPHATRARSRSTCAATAVFRQYVFQLAPLEISECPRRAPAFLARFLAPTSYGGAALT